MAEQQPTNNPEDQPERQLPANKQQRPEYPIVHRSEFQRPYHEIREIRVGFGRYGSHVASLLALLALMGWNPAWFVWAAFFLVEVRFMLPDLASLLGRRDGPDDPGHS